MTNMSSDRFRNTRAALHDAFYALDEAICDEGMSTSEFMDTLSVVERDAFKSLIETCKHFVELAEGE